MKKLLTLAMAIIMMLSVVACTPTNGDEGDDVVETVMVTVLDAEGNDIDVAFPLDPQRIVVLNHQTMDFLDAVGLADRVVGYIKGGTYPAHLQKYIDDENIVNVGAGLKDIDMEAVMSLQPDVIFSSDRTESMYDQFSLIAPTMSASVVYEDGFMNSYKELASKHAQIFNIAGEVDSIIAGYEERIAAIADFAGDQTASLLIFAGGLNALGDLGRCSVIVNEMGFTNVKADEDVNHGDAISYDGLLTLNPDWFFVLDKDTAVGEEAILATEQMDNEIIHQTNAYKNNQIVYLEPGAAWYIADGGITSMDLMITCIEEGIGLK